MSAALAAQVPGTLPGREFPLGAMVTDAGTNFAVASGVADGMVLCLFDVTGAETQIPMRDYDAGVWHMFVPATMSPSAHAPSWCCWDRRHVLALTPVRLK